MNIKYHAQWALTITACVSLTVPFAQGNTIYADDSANGANNGKSWINAYAYLQDALADATDART